MIKFNVKTAEDFGSYLSRFNEKATRAVKVLTSAIGQDSNKYAPHDTGFLHNSMIEDSLLKEGLIIWGAPYARKLYYNWREGLPYSHNNNPNASAEWFEKAKADRLGEWIDIIQNGLGGE